MPELQDLDNTATATARAADGDLRVALEIDPPTSVPAGKATAMFCFGHCFHTSLHVAELVLRVDGVRHRAAATGMPRRDLYEWLHVAQGVDPEGHSYRSGFWATVALDARSSHPGRIALDAEVTLEDGTCQVVPLAVIEVVPNATTEAASDGVITIVMATFEPEPDLFAVQIESLRAQTDSRWRCVISDDGTSDERFAAMQAVISGDPRFDVSRTSERLGPYRNFERALTLAAAMGAELIALSDQDDRWYPQKLSVLRAGLEDAQLVYSDQRLVSSDGRVLRESLWEGRRRDDSNLGSLLIANSVPGAAALFRREVADCALPFPDAPGVPYHDHWLALTALASGRIAYVDEPLYDYVQHAGAVMGGVLDGERTGPTARGARGARGSRGSRGWRGAYFAGYIGRQVLAQVLLLRCSAMLSRRKRRALQWYVAADRSVVSLAWLLLRPLRRFIGRDETLGGEVPIVLGLLWRWLLKLLVAGARSPGRRPFDASFPDPPDFEQPRLRRWRAPQ